MLFNNKVERGDLVHGLMLLSTVFVLVLGTINMMCFTLLFSDMGFSGTIHEIPDYALDRTCRSLYFVFRIKTEIGNDWSWRDMEGLLVQGFALPLLFMATAVLLLKPNSQLYLNFWRSQGGGDPNMHLWTLLFVLAPTCVAIFWPLFTIPKDYIRDISSSLHAWQVRGSMFAAITGDAAVMALSFFLIPVTKHSPLLHVLGLSFTQALVFHRVAGWISLVFTVLHGGLYLVHYATGLFSSSERRQSSGYSHGWRGIVEHVWPPTRCWSWQALDVRSTGWGTMHTNSTSHNNDGHHEDCNFYFFNFTGLASMVAFIVLGIFSLPWMRRRAYRLFYVIHIPAAWIMLLGAICHITYISLFLVPNIIYYLAPTVAVWVQQWMGPKGVAVSSVTEIDHAQGCFLVRLRAAASPAALDTNPDSRSIGGVCKIRLPYMGSIWHPFSVLYSHDKRHLLSLIRPTGPFTQELRDYLLPKNDDENNSMTDDDRTSLLLSRKEPRRLFVDGIYPAEYRWQRQALYLHDVVVGVAGGVGIVPFLHMLDQLMTSEYNNDHTTTTLRHFQIHWYCRKEGLARFVCQNFLQSFLQGSTVAYGINDDESNGDNDADVEVPRSDDQNQDCPPTLLTLEVIVHVTGCRQDDPTLLTRLLAETEGSCDTTVQFDPVAGEEGSFRPAPVSNSLHQDKRGLRVLWWGTLLTVCMVGSWWYYQWETVVGRGHSLLIRIHVVVLCLVSCASFGVALVCCWKGFQSTTITDETGTAGEATTTTTAEDEDQLHAHSTFLPPPRVCKRFRVASGRPPVQAVIQPLVRDSTTTCPAAIFCGPPELRQSVKQAILDKSQQQHTTTKPCVFYDEQSEM